MEVIKKGSRGTDVKKLQELLNLYPDGIFGKLTDEAVREYQKSHNLTVDGIVGPKTWESLLGGFRLKKSRRTIKELIIHCTATKEGVNYSVNDIRRWHTLPVSAGGRGWSDIGYHYVIDLDGVVHEGRDVDITGAHCTNHNSKSIGIVYVGGLDSKGNAKDTRTDEQKKSLKDLVDRLLNLYGLKSSDVHGHCEYANKACPCFDVRKCL